jgi:hypothetical protein
MLAVNELSGRGGGKRGGSLTGSAGTLGLGISEGLPKAGVGRGGGATGGGGATHPALYIIGAAGS